MGERLAKLLLLTIPLGGCSKLYDPDRLPAATDALPDMAIPADPDSPVIESVAPSVIFEGSGVGGSRPALVVLTGMNFVPNNIDVEIKAADGSERMIMVDKAKIVVETHGLRVMVPITLPVDDMLGDASIPLDIRIIQDGSAGPVSSMLTGKLTLKGLPELLAPPAGGLPGRVNEYSRIAITSGTITIAANTTEPVILRSRSSVEITRDISVSALNRTGGPGGGLGGAGGISGLSPGPGMAGTGPSPGLPSGGAAGFASTDVGLATLGLPNRGSGGAGGAGTTLSAGGNGGGGGGSIEITAGGDLSVDAAISATGGQPSSGGNPGGGGSGGVILLRAGGSLKSGAINVAGGGMGAATGASGRARYDAGSTATGAITGHFQGPSFVDLPLITRSVKPELTMKGKPFTMFQYYFTDGNGGRVQGPFSVTMGSGPTTFTVDENLHRGLNQMCLLVDKALLDSDTRTCFDLVYFQ